MNGKWVILIVVIVTLLGIALAYYFLQVLPTNASQVSTEIAMNINHWFSDYLTTTKK